MSNLSRLGDVRRFSKSIIEEWKNSPEFDENEVLRSDQLYEERAIDVVPDCSNKTWSIEKNNLDKSRDDKSNAMKSKLHSSAATVRSIPIKNYQASIAHNIGTLRRSEIPQLQFESSMSEPDKSLRLTKYKTISSPQNEVKSQIRRSTMASKHSEILNPSRRSCHSCDYQREIQNEQRKNSKIKTLDRRIVKSEHNISSQRDDLSDFDSDDYFHKSPPQKYNISHRRSKEDTRIQDQSNEESMENRDLKRLRNEETRIKSKWGTIDFKRGHVGQKISAYEENAKRGNRNWTSLDTYQIFPETNLKKHRAIGVPLVGMHNACGLPVVASWHDHELLEPLRVKGGKILGTLRPIVKGSSRASINFRHRTHPKRRMVETNQSISKRSQVLDLKESDKKIDYPSIKSLVSLEADGLRKKRRHRSSFKAKRTGTFSKNTMKRKSRSDERKDKENCLIGSLYKKSFESGNTKRQTLYARDDGEDAVQVLKSLCLNPLARTKSDTDMIW